MDTVDNNINYWLVGASYGSNDDQTAYFVREGIWKNGYEDRYHDKVNQIKPGDKIGIKAAYVRTRGDSLPFDNRGLHVSTMKIKAVGTVKENLGDGQTLKVDWEKTNLDKEWYLYTAQGTVWKLRKDDWRARNLIEFTFYDKPQKIDKLRNSSYFVERFGDQSAIDQSRFTWTEFYEQLATALLRYKYDRSILVNSIIEINNKTGLIGHLNDQYNDEGSGPLRDICPFTVMGIFNRGIKNSSRVILAKELAQLLLVDAEVPTEFDAIPLLNNQNSWFFGYEKNRGSDDIDKLWQIFEAGISFADQQDEDSKLEFISSFDNAREVKNTSWNLTMGLFWCRPWSFMTLEVNSREYLTKHYQIKFPGSHKGLYSAEQYLDCLKSLHSHFVDDSRFNSFPAISYAAWAREDTPDKQVNEPKPESSNMPQTKKATNVILYGPPGTGKTYLLQQKMNDYIGKAEVPNREDWLNQIIEPLNWMQVLCLCLLDLDRNSKVSELIKHEYFQCKARLNQRDKNLSNTAWATLQSFTIQNSKTVDYKSHSEPAIFDKTQDSYWFIVDEKCELIEDLIELSNKLRVGPQSTQQSKRFTAITFHQSYGYEEFIEGIRAKADEQGSVSYSIEAGKFMALCQRAVRDPHHRYAVFIDEINRGNISKIFGELITLIETDKRKGCKHEMSINLAYSGLPFSVPSNVDIIGTMNTADRSLAMMDTALRRRFDFVEMMPRPELLRGTVIEGIDLEKLLSVLNQRIEILYDREHSLGHAFFMPIKALADAGDQVKAFKALVSVLKNKIIPLLEEYFFEDWSKIRMVLADNQKEEPSLQFVREHKKESKDLDALFGRNHNLDQYGQQVVRFTVSASADDVWTNAQAYIGIYQPNDERNTPVAESTAGVVSL